MPLSNLSLGLGYKGQGSANGIPAYSEDGALQLGGYQALDCTQTAYFGYVVSVNPAGSPDGKMYCGIPSTYVPSGILVYHAGIAQNDPAKPDSFINGQPFTVMYEGTIWLSNWVKVSPFKTVPQITDQVLCDNTTGQIAFIDVGASVPTGYTAIGARVASVSADTSGVMLFVNMV